MSCITYLYNLAAPQGRRSLYLLEKLKRRCYHQFITDDYYRQWTKKTLTKRFAFYLGGNTGGVCSLTDSSVSRDSPEEENDKKIPFRTSISFTLITSDFNHAFHFRPVHILCKSVNTHISRPISELITWQFSLIIGDNAYPMCGIISSVDSQPDFWPPTCLRNHQGRLLSAINLVV